MVKPYAPEEVERLLASVSDTANVSVLLVETERLYRTAQLVQFGALEARAALDSLKAVTETLLGVIRAAEEEAR